MASPISAPLGADPDMVQQLAASAACPRTPPAPWRSGAGRTRADEQADCARRAPRPARSASGSEPGRQRARARSPGPASRRLPAPAAAGSDLVGDHLAERAGVARPLALAAGGRLQRQQREHQLGEAVALLQMRVAGEDEGVDAELQYSCMRAATVSGSPTSAVPAPPRTRPTPAHRLGLISSWSRRPPCSAAMRCWPTESMRANAACALAIAGVVDMADQSLGRGPGLGSSVSRTITCRRMPKRSCAAALRRGAPRVSRSSAPRRPAARPRSGRRRPARPRLDAPASEEPPKYSGG